MSSSAPASRWDCHAHLFGPYERFPLAAERSYTPPEAIEPQYLALLRRLGLTNGVLVHPSAYGDDHSLLLHALAAQPSLRGVVVVRPGSPLRLDGLREQGVRGARFSHRSGAGTNFAGSASIADLQSIAPALADAGLHAELWTDCGALEGIAGVVRALPVPVVIDHMGGFDVRAGVDDPGFRTLLKLLETGKVWVKLCAYRNLLSEEDWAVGRSVPGCAGGSQSRAASVGQRLAALAREPAARRRSPARHVHGLGRQRRARAAGAEDERGDAVPLACRHVMRSASTVDWLRGLEGCATRQLRKPVGQLRRGLAPAERGEAVVQVAERATDRDVADRERRGSQ